MADTPRGPILKKMFAEMDSNGDGVIDEKEGLAIGRLLAGGNAGEAKRFWEEMKAGADTDKNGTVSLDEYVNYGRDVTSANAADVLQLHLARLEEARARQAQQSHRLVDPRAQATRIFRLLDTDGDGRVSMDEFIELAEDDTQALEDLPSLFILMDSEGFKRGDGSLTLDEWLTWSETMPELRDERFAQAISAQLEKAFSAQYSKRSGPVDRETRCRDLFENIDLSGDGFVDLSEYTQARTNKADGSSADAESVAEATNEFLWMDVAQWRKCVQAGGAESVAHDLRLSHDIFVEAFVGMHINLSDAEYESTRARARPVDVPSMCEAMSAASESPIHTRETPAMAASHPRTVHTSCPRTVACRKMELHRKQKKDQELRKRRAKEVFEVMDADSDGYLTHAEVLALQRGLNPSPTPISLLAPRRGRELSHVLSSFFEMLDAGGDQGDSSLDARVSLDDWVAGLMKTLAAKNDGVFVSVVDGMLGSLGKQGQKKKAKGKSKKR
jgi:Ca2+-binding EF-hand superfamily protein